MTDEKENQQPHTQEQPDQKDMGLVAQAKREGDRIEKLLAETKKEADRLEKLKANEILGGTAGIRPPMPPAQVDPKEYANKIMRGELPRG